MLNCLLISITDHTLIFECTFSHVYWCKSWGCSGLGVLPRSLAQGRVQGHFPPVWWPLGGKVKAIMWAGLLEYCKHNQVFLLLCLDSALPWISYLEAILPCHKHRASRPPITRHVCQNCNETFFPKSWFASHCADYDWKDVSTARGKYIPIWSIVLEMFRIGLCIGLLNI